MGKLAEEKYSPTDLLRTAKALLASGEDEYLRAAVMEAMTCLESYVYGVVFPQLGATLHPLLVKFLEDKTKTDFDSRLSVLVPAATGLLVDQQPALWNRYKDDRKLRHRIAHGSLRVTRAEAERAIATAEDWLTYLASTVSMQTAVKALRARAQRGHLQVRTKEAALAVLEEHLRPYLYRSKVDSKGMTDAIFEAGRFRVAVSVAFVDLKSLGALRNLHAGSSGLPAEFTHGLCVAFNRGEPVPDELALRTSADGRVLTAVIDLDSGLPTSQTPGQSPDHGHRRFAGNPRRRHETREAQAGQPARVLATRGVGLHTVARRTGEPRASIR